MLVELIKLANKLDQMGEHEFASELDEILRRAADEDGELLPCLLSDIENVLNKAKESVTESEMDNEEKQ